MDKNHIYIMHAEYRNTLYNMLRYPLAMLIKLGALADYKNRFVYVNGVKKNLLPSHSGIVLYNKGEFHVIEFMGSGISVMKLKDKQEHYKGKASLVLEELILDLPKNFLVSFWEDLQSFQDEKYDVAGALLSFADGQFNKIKRNMSGTFCSSFVAQVLLTLDISIENEKGTPNEQEPADIVYSRKTWKKEPIKSAFLF